MTLCNVKCQISLERTTPEHTDCVETARTSSFERYNPSRAHAPIGTTDQPRRKCLKVPPSPFQVESTSGGPLRAADFVWRLTQFMGGITRPAELTDETRPARRDRLGGHMCARLVDQIFWNCLELFRSIHIGALLVM